MKGNVSKSRGRSGASVELSEFVDLFEVCYGSLQSMLDKRVVAFSFHNNESDTEILLRKVTDSIAETVSVSVYYDYVVFAHYMGEEIAVVKFEPGEVINLYNIFDISPLRHEYPDDGLYIDSTEMSVCGRVLFDGVTNMSTAAALFKNGSSKEAKPSVEISEFVDLFDVFYGDKTDMQGKSLIAIENQGSGNILTVDVTKDDVTEEYYISFSEGAIDIGGMADSSAAECGVGEVFNLYEHFGLSGSDTIIVTSVELGITERGLFDGVANLSTIASLFAKKTSSESASKYAEVKYVEVGDDITMLLGQDGYPDVTIGVEVTMSCGCSFTDTIKYYTEDYITYLISSTYYDPSSYTSIDLHNGDKFSLIKHYSYGHQDATYGSCDETPTKILVKSVTYGGNEDGETRVITNGDASTSFLVQLGVI